MTEPRHWILKGEPQDEWDDGSLFVESIVWDGPRLEIEEKVEVIEVLPGVIIDTLGPDVRGEDAPSFRAEPHDAFREPPHAVRRTWRKRIGNYRITLERMNLRV